MAPITMVTIRDPQSIVNLQIVMTEDQVNAWRSRGYMKLEELRAMPRQLEQLRQQVEDMQRRLEDQSNLIHSLRRTQAG